MSACKCFFSSSIGQKVVMALSGLIIIGFILGHLLGNMLVFAGPDALNSYAYFLKHNPEILWTTRIILFIAFVSHIFTAIKLKVKNADARPVSYRYSNTVQATLSSRTMGISGSFLLLFVITHLMHFTIGNLDPQVFNQFDPQGRHNVYAMVVIGFQHVKYSAIYIIAMLFLGFHLSHAIESSLQSLGFNHSKITPVLRNISPIVGVGLALGYISIPLSVLLGIVDIPVGGV